MKAALKASEVHTSTHAPSMIQLGQRVLVLVGLTALSLLLIWLWLSWQGIKQAQTQRMRMASSLLAAQTEGYLETVADRMKYMARELRRADALERPSDALVQLRRFKAENPNLAGATLILPNGQIFASTAQETSKPLPNVLVDPEWREDFLNSLTEQGLSVNRPQLSYLIKQWILPLRYTMRDDNGQATHVLQTSILLEDQQLLWRSMELPPGIAIGLLREDGYLISRWPNDPSGSVYRKKLLDGALYKDTRESPDGVYEGVVSADGVYRLGAYQRLAQHPLYLFMSLPRVNIIQMWWQMVQLPVYILIVMMLASAISYALIARGYIRRMRAIEDRMRDVAAPGNLPSSGVREIDQLVSALADTQEQLRLAALNRERLLLTAADAGTYMVRERDGVVLAADATFLLMLGRHESEVVGLAWNELFSMPITSGAATDEEPAILARRTLSVSVPSGDRPRWISVAEYRDTSADGEWVHYGLAIDVSDREYLLSQVNVQSQRLQALWQLATTRDKSDDEKMQLMLRMALGTLHMDTVLVIELRGDKMVVRTETDDLHRFHIGQEFSLTDVLCRQVALVIPDLRADPDLYRHPMSVEFGLRAFASAPIWAGPVFYGTMVFMRRAPLDENFSADDRAFMELLAAWVGQILLERQQHDELESMAMTDALTRLTNRRAAEARFIEEFARARRAGDIFSIAVCDLDRFKLVNDHYGHDTGDEVLLHVAGIMKAELREGDWVARWGGEEFIIFLHQSDAAVAHVAMERLRLAIKGNPVSTSHGPLDVTTSIGIGTFRGEGDLASVLSEADGCLYEAKHAGRDQVVVSASTRRGTLWKAGMLQHALLENRLVPAYQVMVDLRTNEAVADEALARLIEPDGRILPAGEFIEAAEGINLIHVVDEVIVRQSIQRCAVNARDGKEHPGFAHFVNLSPQFLARRELVEAMLQQVSEQCMDCGTATGPVKSIVLEITERQLIGNFDDLIKDLQPLLDFGFRLALDDFGSGYSSFLYLASLPVSFLKIEGWMVQNMRSNPKVLGMVKSIIALARDQGLTTIAECVEDAATAELLRDLGADWGQGWFFGRPECEIDPLQVIKVARTGAYSETCVYTR
jgi:diguanylate cyclase (GGDEF)-like protein